MSNTQYKIGCFFESMDDIYEPESSVSIKNESSKSFTIKLCDDFAFQ
jgi:hypothetical protein